MRETHGMWQSIWLSINKILSMLFIQSSLITLDVCLSLPCDFFMSFEAKARFPCWKWVKSVVKSFGLNSCPTDFQPNALSQTPWPASYPPVKHTKNKSGTVTMESECQMSYTSSHIQISPFSTIIFDFNSYPRKVIFFHKLSCFQLFSIF